MAKSYKIILLWKWTRFAVLLQEFKYQSDRQCIIGQKASQAVLVTHREKCLIPVTCQSCSKYLKNKKKTKVCFYFINYLWHAFPVITKSGRKQCLTILAQHTILPIESHTGIYLVCKLCISLYLITVIFSKNLIYHTNWNVTGPEKRCVSGGFLFGVSYTMTLCLC